MSLGQPVGGKKNEDLNSIMAVEGEKSLDRCRRMNKVFEEDGESCRIKCKFVFLDWAQDMKEVMKDDRTNRQSFENSGILLVQISQHGNDLILHNTDLWNSLSLFFTRRLAMNMTEVHTQR